MKRGPGVNFSRAGAKRPREGAAASGGGAGGDGDGSTGGDWPCHVFIRIGPRSGVFSEPANAAGCSDGTPTDASGSDDDSSDSLDQLVRAAEPVVRAQAEARCGRSNPHLCGTGRSLHISLSHGFSLRHHERLIFLDRLRKEFLQQPAFEVVVTDEVVSYVNRKGTRRFYAMRVSGGKDIVVKLIRRVDDIMASFNLERYHSDPKIHVSIAWAETSDADAAQASVAFAQSKPTGTGVECAFKVNDLRCRIGDRVNIIRLKR